MVIRTYTRWDAPGVEAIPADEQQHIDAVIRNINESQRRFQTDGRCFTGTHARTRGIVHGSLVVPNDLPAHLKQTDLFSTAATYPVACRYSSEPGNPQQDDRISQPRGFAIKIFNVHGPRFAAPPTHDMEFNSTPAIELSDARTAHEIFDLRLQHSFDARKMAPALEARPDTALQKARDAVPNLPLEAIPFYSQAAFRFGAHVAKFRVVPAETQRRSTPITHDGALAQHLRDFYRTSTGRYVLQAQLLEDLGAQPVEDCGVEWDEDRFPFQTVAELRLPPQESWDEERNAFWAHRMRLDPWHGLKELQPLGGANRLRRMLYPASSKFRREANGLTEVNVTSLSEIPGF